MRTAGRPKSANIIDARAETKRASKINGQVYGAYNPVSASAKTKTIGKLATFLDTNQPDVGPKRTTKPKPRADRTDAKGGIITGGPKGKSNESFNKQDFQVTNFERVFGGVKPATKDKASASNSSSQRTTPKSTSTKANNTRKLK